MANGVHICANLHGYLVHSRIYGASLRNRCALRHRRCHSRNIRFREIHLPHSDRKTWIGAIRPLHQSFLKVFVVSFRVNRG